MNSSNSEVHIDQLIRSKRRSISLEIERDGSLTVRAPQYISIGEIQALVKSKASWISKKKTLLRNRGQETPPKRFTAGEQFLYLGNAYLLEIVAGQDSPLILRDHFFLTADTQENALQVFRQWYKEQASQVIKGRTAILAQNNGIATSKIRITSAKTRWGSCGPKGSLNFTWRLVMAPEDVIDYVIVHELAHLRIRNHSENYWEAVRLLMPDYQIRLKWLKDNGHRLRLD